MSHSDLAQAKPPNREPERGSGGQGRAPEPRYLAVGQIVGAHGVRGELKIRVLTQDRDRFGWMDQVLVGPDDVNPIARVVEGHRFHKQWVLLKIEGCDDRTAAQALRGHWILVSRDEALPLEEDEYFQHQILDLAAWTAAGEHLGTVVEIIETGANDVYVIATAGGRQLLVPAIEEVILEVDLDAGRLVVELLDGLR